MSLWNYIGEFFLFRWLFGSHKQNETPQNMSDTSGSFGNKNIIDDNDIYTLTLVTMRIVTFAMAIVTMAIPGRMMISMTNRTTIYDGR